MLYPEELAVGLKEWDCVCQALITGKQIILLRKGGIHESGGEFEVEFRRFLLFPTFLHQDKSVLKPEAQDLVRSSGAEPRQIQLDAFADVTDIIRIDEDYQLPPIRDYHIWTDKLVDMRLNYRPENPLYILLCRAHRLPAPITIDNHKAYGGCKSWVGLRQTIDVCNATPVLDSPTYQKYRDEIVMKISSAKPPQEQPAE